MAVLGGDEGDGLEVERGGEEMLGAGFVVICQRYSPIESLALQLKLTSIGRRSWGQGRW